MADGRTERWVGHRERVREDLVDAAFRAVDRVGANISIREIAQEAQVPKANLYRFFADKSDIYAAIGERVNTMVLDRIVTNPRASTETFGSVVHACLTGWAGIVAEHPNVCRFLLIGYSAAPEAADKRFQLQANAASVVGEILRNLLDIVGSHDQDVELDTFLIVGLVESATNWWLGKTEDRGGVADFVSCIERRVRALISQIAADSGVAIDFNQPISDRLWDAVTSAATL